ncbi:hypothetical protein [Bizionia arctica]|uniref:7(1) septoil knot domain-containing protein n=1 Tax=Bizionia arctica TaxID=1495645 RepID=A0A917GES3_9FLAO|nr:hypothetical protein [Bizionia arctica]GGG42386.1 hypothetical protein GCM10010976_12410 [Bizionia arctica]
MKTAKYVSIIILLGILVISCKNQDRSSIDKLAILNFSPPEEICEINDIKLYGKVKFVTSFPDLKIQYVSSFPDIKVQFVESFPEDCGQWHIVESFPDFTIQVVESFPDIKVQVVSSFPGMN